MSPKLETDSIFFDDTGLNPDIVRRHVAKALRGGDDGELFLEHMLSENLTWSESRLKNSSNNEYEGFSLRYIESSAMAHLHNNDLSLKAIRAAANSMAGARSSLAQGARDTFNMSAKRKLAVPKLYGIENPLDSYTRDQKIKLLSEIDAYIRAKESSVQQITISLSGSRQAVQIIRPHEGRMEDIRPMARCDVTVEVSRNGKSESGHYGFGGRSDYSPFFSETGWKHAADEALRQALVKLEAVDAPAGQMDVVMGAGWNGVMLHEAVGHGLEGDFNRKGASVFSGKIGEQVTAKGVTIVDDGSIPGRRGSLTIDDEGTPSQRTVLIEDGILKGYMQDRINGRLMGVKSTGNGRRENYSKSGAIMPRMTNTIMESGEYDPAEIIASVKNGIYIAAMGGGQVDIVSGNFVFEMTEAYKIENGKVTAPVKGATLTGKGLTAMQNIAMVGNDSALDNGIGTCGKAGQGVPVGVGQPTVLMRNLTVGGRAPS